MVNCMVNMSPFVQEKECEILVTINNNQRGRGTQFNVKYVKPYHIQVFNAKNYKNYEKKILNSQSSLTHAWLVRQLIDCENLQEICAGHVNPQEWSAAYHEQKPNNIFLAKTFSLTAAAIKAKYFPDSINIFGKHNREIISAISKYKMNKKVNKLLENLSISNHTGVAFFDPGGYCPTVGIPYIHTDTGQFMLSEASYLSLKSYLPVIHMCLIVAELMKPLNHDLSDYADPHDLDKRFAEFDLIASTMMKHFPRVAQIAWEDTHES